MPQYFVTPSFDIEIVEDKLLDQMESIQHAVTDLRRVADELYADTRRLSAKQRAFLPSEAEGLNQRLAEIRSTARLILDARNLVNTLLSQVNTDGSYQHAFLRRGIRRGNASLHIDVPENVNEY